VHIPKEAAASGSYQYQFAFASAYDVKNIEEKAHRKMIDVIA